VAVLGKLIAQRQLPDLWKARATLVERFDAGKAGEGASDKASDKASETESVTPQPEETDGRPDD
jgi:hypothetical protein